MVSLVAIAEGAVVAWHQTELVSMCKQPLLKLVFGGPSRYARGGSANEVQQKTIKYTNNIRKML